MTVGCAAKVGVAFVALSSGFPVAHAATCLNHNESGLPYDDGLCKHTAGFLWALKQPLPESLCSAAHCSADECCNNTVDGEHHKNLSIALSALCAAFVAAVCLSDLVEKEGWNEVIPSSTVMILMGMLLGVLGITFHTDGQHPVHEFMEFDPEIFGFFLLPVIIFSSAYNMGQGAMQVFFVQLGRISFFAIFGTVIAISFTGVLILVADRTVGGFIPSGEMEVSEIFMFSSLISAVDPVATLGAFAALGIEPKLNALVYGESILNDAVAIGAYRVFEEMKTEGEDFAPSSAALSVLWLMGGSLLCGIACGLMAALVFKHLGRRSRCFGAKHGDDTEDAHGHAGAHATHAHQGEGEGGHEGEETEHAMVEAASFFFCSMSSFYIAEIFHLSGIISALFAGMVSNHYAWFNLTPAAQTLSKNLYEQLMCILEQLVCVWVGVVFVFALEDGVISWGFTLFALLVVMTSRAVTVFPLAAAVNAVLRWRERPEETLTPMSHQKIMFVAGLRGAIALVLVVGLPIAEVRRQYFIAACAFIIIFTNVVLGGCTVPAVKKLQIPNKASGTLSHSSRENMQLSGQEMAHARLWGSIDRKYFMPWFRLEASGLDRLKQRLDDIKQLAAAQKAQAAAAGERGQIPATAFQIFRAIDIDGSGGLVWDEFDGWWRSRQQIATGGYVDEAVLQRGHALFAELDGDGDGILSLGEFVEVLQQLAASDWVESIDRQSGQMYWYNKSSLETQWARPTADVDAFVEEAGVLPPRQARQGAPLPALTPPGSAGPSVGGAARRKLPLPQLDDAGAAAGLEVEAVRTTESPLARPRDLPLPLPVLSRSDSAMKQQPPPLGGIDGDLPLPPRRSRGAPPMLEALSLPPRRSATSSQRGDDDGTAAL